MDKATKKHNISKKHHMSPQFYLKKWCNEDERLHRGFQPEPGKWHFDRKLPEDVAFKKYLYRITGSNDEKYCFEDDIMTKTIDTPFSILYEKIISEGLHKVSINERKKFAYYLSSFQARNERLLKNTFEKEYDNFTEAPEDIDEIAKRFGVNISSENKKRFPEFLENMKRMFKSKEDFGKFSMLAVINTSLEEASQKLLETRWMIVNVNKKYSPIVTSDFPLISIGGFGNDGTAYVFPLTPHEVLIMKNNDDIFEMMRGWSEPQVISFVNLIIVGHAKEVYYKHKGHEKFIERYLGKLIDLYDKPNFREYLAKLLDEVFSYAPQYMNDIKEGLAPTSKM